MITRDTIVVGVPPSITPTRFGEVLLAANSPAFAESYDMYAVCDANEVDPTFLLAIFKNESQFGKVGVCRDYNTKSPGNTRTSRTGATTLVTVPGKGQYVKYASWMAGADDAAYR